jgi:competence protein ComEC
MWRMSSGYDTFPRMHRSQVFLLICCAFLVGIAAASWLHIATLVMWGVVAVAGILMLIRRGYSLIVGALLLAAIVGVYRAQSVLTKPSVLWQVAESKPAVSLTGYVDGDFEPTATGGRFVFRVLRINTGEGSVTTNDRLLVSGPGWIRPRQGQWLILNGKIQQPKNYEDFDYVSYLAKEGIHAVMYFPKYDVPLDDVASLTVRTRVSVVAKLAAVRGALMESISRAVPQPESGYLAGLLVGAKGNVNAQLKEAFARTGTSHIVALSGYNITIIATVLMMLLAPLGMRRSYWLAVIAIALFTVMVGAGASVVRASIMGVLAMTAQRMGRLSDAGIAMAVTAALMCWYNPLVLRWDVGFQLSFLAFMGIVYVQPLLEPYAVRIFRFKPLASIVSTTLSAQVLVLPLLLYVFGTLAVYTLPVNVLVLPLVPIAMALGFATAVAGMVWSWAGFFIGQSAWLVAALQLFIITRVAALPSAAFVVQLSAPLMIALYLALATWLISLYRGRVIPTTNQEESHAGTHTRTAEAGRGRQGNPGGNHLPF